MFTGESTPDPVGQDPRVTEFVTAFRELKHQLLNSIAIWMAQAELAHRNPDFHEKLARSILDRSQRLLELAQDAEVKIKAVAPYSPEAGGSRQ